MIRRVAPALGLFFLSPLVGEFLLGNVSIDALPAGLIMAPMYGGGAVLVREAARRAGKGWPTILLLALAYGVVEEGLVTQTLFTRSYFGHDLLRETYIPAIRVGAWWTLFVLTLHTVWSISVPIAIMESLVPGRATTPWLGKPGLAVVSILYLLGSAAIFGFTYSQEHYIAPAPQIIGTVISAGALIVASFAVGKPVSRSGRPAPVPWRAGAFSFLVAGAFMGSRYLLADWPIVGWYLLLYALAAIFIVRWSGRAGWGQSHRLALAGGALLTYAWHSFPEKPVLGSGGTIDLVGNAVFSLIAVALLVAAGRCVTCVREGGMAAIGDASQASA